MLTWEWGGTSPSYNTYKKYFLKAKIYHFCTGEKVWLYPNMEHSNIWWKYARISPFYEEIVQRMLIYSTQKDSLAILNAKNDIIASQNHGVSLLRQEFAKIHFPNINNHFAANERYTKLLFVLDHLWRFKAKKAYYAVKKAFAFGEKHKKYQQKYDTVKALVKEAKSFKKQLLKV